MKDQISTIAPDVPADPAWIDQLSDEQCAEVFWLYLESPDEFLKSHSPSLLGAAMRYALRVVSASTTQNLGSPSVKTTPGTSTS